MKSVSKTLDTVLCGGILSSNLHDRLSYKLCVQLMDQLGHKLVNELKSTLWGSVEDHLIVKLGDPLWDQLRVR